ncbi:MAG: hypothetical protein Q4D02_06745 [Clostridia bacterium]|nr:hypothetical protein [Clostridia bacterium]
MIKSENWKTYLLSAGLICMLVLLIVSIVNGISIGSLKILSVKDITSKEDEVKLAETNLELVKTRYDILNSQLLEEKKSFEAEKSKYEAISDETVDIINKINTKEKYSIEYIWIKLGNYADASNLSIIVAEPGNSIHGEEETEDNSIFKIQVSGSYINVADFIYNIENDSELKFQLDNIKMEYVSGTSIKASFDVKDIVIVK